MSISTFSTFYYGHTIDATNNLLDFKEGATTFLATLDYGEYTLTEFLAEVKRAMEETGAFTYTVSVNRSTRIITIAATGTFSLLTTSGSNIATSPFTLLGFSGADKTGSASYTASAASGSAYTPQFKLQEYVPKENQSKAEFNTVLQTATGDVEAIKFADLDRIDMNIKFATNIAQPSNGPITSNTSGVANLNTFMRYITTKAPVEFMPDASTPATYSKVILDSTSSDSKGMSYALKELLGIKLAGYYETGKLVFRVME